MIETSKTTKICVRLLEEGVNSARWAPTIKLGENIYKLLPTLNYDPEDEIWEFLPGSVVRCTLDNEFPPPCLLAVEKIDEKNLSSNESVK